MSILFYDKNADEFFTNTINSNMQQLYTIFEETIPKKHLQPWEILDLGCGSGRDSKYFISAGYKVTALDFSKILAQKASAYIGQEVIVKDMRQIEYLGKFVGIWACASLLHLTETEILATLQKCLIALKKDGALFASFKYGKSNYQKDGRSFTCFTQEKFLNLVETLNCPIQTFLTSDVCPERANEKWLNILLKNTR